MKQRNLFCKLTLVFLTLLLVFSLPVSAAKESPSDELKALRETTPDATIWISGTGTTLDGAAAQSKDNTYYLRRNLAGEISFLGVPFLDYRCQFGPNGTDLPDRTIIYTHQQEAVLTCAQNADTIIQLSTPDGTYYYEILNLMVLPVELPYNRPDISRDEWNKAIGKAYFLPNPTGFSNPKTPDFTRDMLVLSTQTTLAPDGVCASFLPGYRLALLAQRISEEEYNAYPTH